MLYFKFLYWILIKGITAVVGGRPKPVPCLKLFSFLYPKSKMDAKIEMNEQVIIKMIIHLRGIRWNMKVKDKLLKIVKLFLTGTTPPHPRPSPQSVVSFRSTWITELAWDVCAMCNDTVVLKWRQERLKEFVRGA